jgi:hypothetical protein
MPLIELHQVRPAYGGLVGQVGQVLQGAAQPVQFCNDELGALAVGRHQGLVEVGSADQLAGRGVEENFLAPGRVQGVVLGGGVLVAGGDPRVADAHARHCNGNPRQVDVAADTARFTPRPCGNAS